MGSSAPRLPTTETMQFRTVGGAADSVERRRVHYRGPTPTTPICTLSRNVLDPPPLAACHRLPLAVARVTQHGRRVEEVDNAVSETTNGFFRWTQSAI